MSEKYPPSIAVIGLSCWFPGSRGPRRLWENILARRRQFREIPERRLSHGDYFDPDGNHPDKTYCIQAAVIDGFQFDWAGNHIPYSTWLSTDIVHWLSLEMAAEALSSAGIRPGSISGERAGVILGNTLTGEISRANGLRLRWPYVRKMFRATWARMGLPLSEIGAFENLFKSNFKSAFPATSEDSLSGGLSNTIAGRICNHLKFFGGGYTIDGACASSLLAVSNACDGLIAGNLDLALAGGVDISLDPYELAGFSRAGALAKRSMKVYDRHGTGFIPGEGCGFVLLKRAEDAVRDQNYIYALIRGWGISSDGGVASIMAPGPEGQSRALKKAYAMAPHKMEDLDFIEGHGTGTTVGDRAELEGIILAMGGSGPSMENQDIRPIGITSLKSILGHTKAASGVAGLIKAVLAVNQRVIPPTAGCNRPHAIFEKEAKQLYPILQGEILPPDRKMLAGLSALGFGGINCHVTLESAGKPHADLTPSLPARALLVSNQESEIFVLTGNSEVRLARKIDHLQELCKGISIAELTDLAAKLGAETRAGAPWRGAVIAGMPNTLSDRLSELKKNLEDSAPDRGRVVYNREKSVWLGNRVEKTGIGILFPDQGPLQLNMARVLANRFDWARRMLKMAEETSSREGTLSLGQLIYKPLDRERGPETSEKWLNELSSPQNAQPAICLVSMLWYRFLSELGIFPVAVGGHGLGELTAFWAAGAFDRHRLIHLAAIRGRAMALSPNEADTAGRLKTKDFPDSFPTQLKTRLFSSISGREVSPPLSMREHFAPRAEPSADYLSGFLSMLKLMSNTCSMFLEVGPGRALTEQADEFFKADGPLRFPVESEPGRDLDLNTALAAAFIHGVDLKWEKLYESRLVMPFTPASEKIFIENPCEKPEPSAVSDGTLPTHAEVSALKDAFSRISPGSLPLEPGEPWKQATFPADFSASLKKPVSKEGSGGMDREPVEKPSGEMTHAETDTKSLVISLLTRITGFPEKSLSLDMRLLDDLNLDSIKAADLIAKAANKMEIKGPIDTPGLSNGKISEIIDSLETQAGDEKRLEALKPSEEKTEVPENFFQIPGAGVDPERGQEYPAGPWVREFAMETVAAPGDFHEMPHAPDDEMERNHPNILILSDSIHRKFCRVLSSAFLDRGAIVRIATFEEAEVEKMGSDPKYTILLAFLPPSDQSGIIGRARLEKAVCCLSGIASPPNKANAYPKKTTVAYVQFCGGKFGTDPQESHPEQVYASALAKSLHLERSDLQVRFIDLSPQLAPEKMTEAIFHEIQTPEPFAAAGYDHSHSRFEQIARVLEPADYRPREIDWNSRDVILVTGGAKGITASIALDLARKTGVRMALVGSSPSPERNSSHQSAKKILATLKQYRESGHDAVYYSCDVTDPDAVTRLVNQIAQEMGPITGVIHGAGLNNPKPLNQTSVSMAMEEISPKVLGAMNLMRTLSRASLKMFVGIGSLIAHSGMAGNAWYAFSNQMLSNLLARFRISNPRTRVLAISFGIWRDIGMGTRMGSVRQLKKMGIDAIPTSEGVDRFIRLFLNDSGYPETIVSARLSGPDTWKTYPFLPTRNLRYQEKCLRATFGVESVFKVHLDLDRDPYLKDHIYNGSYLFPTVFGLEAMAQAVTHATGISRIGRVRIENIRLIKPITVDPETGTDILIKTIVAERKNSGQARKIFAAIFKPEQGEAQFFFSATFIIGLKDDPPKKIIETSREPTGIRPNRELYRKNFLFHGPLFQRISKIGTISLEKDKHSESARRVVAYSKLVPSDDSGREAFSCPDDAPLVMGDPLFRDSLFHLAQILVPREICLPVYVGAMEIYPSPESVPSDMMVEVKLMERGDRELKFEVIAVDANGLVRESLSGYTLRVLRREENNPTPYQLIHPGEMDDGKDRRALIHAQKQSEVPAFEIGPWESTTEKSNLPLDYIYEDLFSLKSFEAVSEGGPQGQDLFVHRFPVTFKPNAQLSRRVYYSNYFFWLGEIREASVWPVLKKIGEQFSTGKFGLITNSTHLRILGEATVQDRIEVRFWVPENGGPTNSTMDLTFDYRKILPDGRHERLAWCDQRVTWVQILEHGKAKPAPYPQYYWDFMKNMLPKNEARNVGDPLPEPLLFLKDNDRDLTKFTADEKPSVKPVLFEKVIETSLENSNIVGNIYFANYYAWQGQTRDHYFFSLVPELFRGVGEKGELLCLETGIDHLREAMPFDKIIVTMALKVLKTFTARFYFEFFRLEPDNSRTMLAFGEQLCAWVTRGKDKTPLPAAFPKAVLDHMLSKIEALKNKP